MRFNYFNNNITIIITQMTLLISMRLLLILRCFEIVGFNPILLLSKCDNIGTLFEYSYVVTSQINNNNNNTWMRLIIIIIG